MPLPVVGLIHAVALADPGLARNRMPFMLPMYTVPSGAELMLSGYRLVPSMTMSGGAVVAALLAWLRASAADDSDSAVRANAAGINRTRNMKQLLEFSGSTRPGPQYSATSR